VPAKPVWYNRIHEILGELRSLPRPFVDRTTVEFLLRVGRRRAQQIMAPCIVDRIGSNGLADREKFIAHLERLAQGEDGYYERARRSKFAEFFRQLHQERIRRPQVPVEASDQIVNQEFKDLPPGIHLEPGAIRLEFGEPQEALEKLLALAMAIGNDLNRFEHLTRKDT
jgi:hypothetical protein